MSSKSKRNHNGKGRPPSLSARDQAAAAAAENWTQLGRRVAHGARMREALIADAAEVYQSLLDAYGDACDEARNRYEENTPTSEWVSGRSQWGACEHLRGGPAPAHWTPVYPEQLLCTTCWECFIAFVKSQGAVPCQCCGRFDDNLTYISVADRHLSVTLQAAVCDTCYPEGADAPKVDA